jgi:hypothetical protein
MSRDDINHIHKEHIRVNIEIVNIILKMKYRPFVKLHPIAYNTSDKHQDRAFWKDIGCSIIKGEDTFGMYKHMDVGISFLSHSALDVNYHKKPFIYVKSDKFPVVNHASWKLHKYCSIPLGPSKMWDKLSLEMFNKFFPSWVGLYTELESLEYAIVDCLESEFPNEQYDKFIDEFWYKNDGKASERIIDELLKMMDS